AITENKLGLGIQSGATAFAIGLHDRDGDGRNLGSTFPVNVRVMRAALAEVYQADAPVANSVELVRGATATINSDGFTIPWTSAEAVRRQFLYLLGAAYPTAGACAGGGAGPTITDPPSTDVAIASAKAPIVFVEIAFDGGTKRYAAVPLADPS